MCKKDKCCCPSSKAGKKKVAGKRRGKVGKARMNASQVLAMGASMPRAVPAVPLYTNNPLGEDQLTAKQATAIVKPPIVILAPQPPKPLDISRKADKPDRKMKSMVAEALAPPTFASTQAPPQTIALPPRAPIAPSVEFAPPVAQSLEQTRKPMYDETAQIYNTNKQAPRVEPPVSTPFFKSARQGRRTIQFGEGQFRMVQAVGRPPNSLRLPPPL